MKNNTVVRLTESAVMLAFATVLSMLKVMDMPFGGSVTACSMLPVVLIAYRHGVKWGLLVGAADGLIQLLLGANTLAYATSWVAAAAIIVLDFLAAFTVLGLGGIFRNKVKNQAAAVALGALVCCALRYLFHVIAGCTVWAGVSIPAGDGLLYSLVYNAAYMVPETIVTVAGAFALCGMLDFRGERLQRLSAAKSSFAATVCGALSVVAVAADAVLLFAAMQTEDGYDITALAGANWLLIGVIGGAAVLFAALAAVTVYRKNKKDRLMV